MSENTSKRSPAEHLIGLLAQGQTGYIEGMEAAGQAELVNSTQIPARGNPTRWDVLIELGFSKPEPVEDDELFVTTTLPEGWSKQPTDHSMWSKIVDERGVERVEIFYKAAFYDRDAFFRIVRVGGDLAYRDVFSKGPVQLPSEWDVLTEDERADYVKTIDNQISQWEKGSDSYRDIYADTTTRAREIRTLLDKT